MPRYFRLPNPAISGIAVDGVSHSVEDGLLVVHRETHNLERELAGHFRAMEVLPEDVPDFREKLQADAAKAARTEAALTNQQQQRDESERQGLFTQLEALIGRKIDRRRSLKQLRAMAQKLESGQALNADETGEDATQEGATGAA